MIIEVPELKGMRRSEIDHVKAMLSRQVDEARLAYGREPTAAARQFIMIGTVNSDSKGEARYLKDDTGNRRFWPVLIDEVDLKALKRDRRQLWAEAYARRKESLVLDRELWTSSEREQKQRMEQSFDHTFVANYLSDRNPDDVIMQEDIWEHLKKPLANVTQPLRNELGRVLKSLGYEPKKFRKNGNSCWGYARSKRSE
jgi:predicted P-loop ATPase